MELTAQQKKLLLLIGNWREGLPLPSTLAEHMGLAGESSVRAILKLLVEVGLVERLEMGPGLPKVPRLTPKGRAIIGLPQKPLREFEVRSGQPWPVMLHPAPCGPLTPTCAEVRPMETSDVFPQWRDGDRVVQAEGDSMVSPDAGDRSIYPGDLVHLRPGVAPANGDQVYVEYVLDTGERECTLKEFHIEPHTSLVTLRALNPEYPPIVRPGTQVELGGIVWDVFGRRQGRRK